jgi:quercetin dioxygenase-like cupin family protein
MPMSEEILDNPVTGESMRILESTAQVFKAQYSLRPHGEIPHPRKEQRISILSGEMHLRINGEHKVLRAGESATLPLGANHFQWNPCDSEVVVVEEVRPAGRIHDFFKVLFGLARDGKTDQNGFPSPVLAAALFSEFKDTILPSPLGSRILIGVLGPVALALGYRSEVEKYLHE